MDDLSKAIDAQKHLLHDAQSHIVAGDFDAALTLIQRAKDPRVAVEGILFLEGLCLVRAGKILEGLDALLVELESFADNKEARRILGETLQVAQCMPHQKKERSLLTSLANPDGYILDIGSNVGNFAQAFLERGFRVVSVEPNPKTAHWQRERLRQKINENKFTLIEKALSSSEKSLYLYPSTDLCKSFSSVDSEWCNGFPDGFDNCVHHSVQTITFTSLLRKFSPQACALAKIDAPGHEAEIIRELQNIESNLLPSILVVEIISSRGANMRRQKVTSYLHKIGFQEFKIMISWGNLLIAETPWISHPEIEIQDLSSSFEVYGSKPDDVPVLSIIARSKSK